MTMVTVTRTQQTLASKATVARTFPARLQGLLGRPGLSDGEAMIFPQCNAIHTLGMRFPIDVLFVDRAFRVVAVRSHLQPWRLAGPVPGAWAVVETACGTLARLGVQVGDELQVVEKNGHSA